MHKKWYAFDIGPNGGISASAISSALDSRKAAEDWAMARFPKSQAAQIAIVELIAVAERDSPPVKITEVLPAFGEIAKAA